MRTMSIIGIVVSLFGIIISIATLFVLKNIFRVIKIIEDQKINEIGLSEISNVIFFNSDIIKIISWLSFWFFVFFLLFSFIVNRKS